MKKTTQIIYWAFLLSAALVIPSFAQDNTSAGKPAADNENRDETAVNRLNLNAEQKEKIKTLRQNQKQQMTELRQSLKEAREKLKDELDNPDATRNTIAPLAENVKTILAKMVDRRIEGVSAVKEILNPEQFKQLQQGRQKMRKDERPGLEKRRARGIENKKQSEDDINE